MTTTLTIDGDVARVALRSGATVTLDSTDLWVLDDHNLTLAIKHSSACVLARPKETGGRRGGRMLRLARLIMSPTDKMVVDHINGDPLDNRRANLRVCTSTTNNRNRAKRSGTSSQFKGVTRSGPGWVATISENYLKRWLGRFETETAAAQAYDAAARAIFGNDGAFNFPTKGEQAAQRPRSLDRFHVAHRCAA